MPATATTAQRTPRACISTACISAICDDMRTICVSMLETRCSRTAKRSAWVGERGMVIGHSGVWSGVAGLRLIAPQPEAPRRLVAQRWGLFRDDDAGCAWRAG